MSPVTLRYLIAGVLLAHGVGHVMGLMPALRLGKAEGWSSHSWLLTPLLGDGAARAVSFVLFFVAMIGFLLAGLGVLGWGVSIDWWRTAALLSAIVSLVALALFWHALVAFFPNKLGAIAVNLAVLVGLLWFQFPTQAAIGF